MELGVDSFAAQLDENKKADSEDALSLLLDRIEWADKMGLDVFGIGEHSSQRFLVFGTHIDSCGGGGRDETNKTNQRCYRTERSGSGTCISKFCHVGYIIEGQSRNSSRAWFFRGSLSAFRT